MTIMKNSIEGPQKIKNRDICAPINLTLVYITKGSEISMLKKCLYPRFYYSIIYCSQDMETTSVSIDR